MPTAKKALPQHLWWVRHPECGLAVVNAPNREQATVEAAAWWETPWRKIAALCECEREEIVPRHLCICCGTIFNGEGFRCTKCEIIERDKRLNQRARARKYYRSMMPVRHCADQSIRLGTVSLNSACLAAFQLDGSPIQ